MFKNNSVKVDTNWQHLERCQLCASASRVHKDELGLRELWVIDMEEHATDFESSLNTQNICRAEYHGATADLGKKRYDLYGMICSVRWMIRTIINDPALSSGDQRMIEDIFDMSQAVNSHGYNLMVEIANDILTGQEKLIEMAAAWRIPDDVIADLTAKKNLFEAANIEAKLKHGEKLKATERVHQMRKNGNDLLHNIFYWIIAVWDDDDSRLLEFGFVPRSMIWSEKLPTIPKNLRYDESAMIFSWDRVEGAISYDLDYRGVGSSGNWTRLYSGAESFCGDKPDTPGEYDFRLRAWDVKKSSKWSNLLTVVITG